MVDNATPIGLLSAARTPSVPIGLAGKGDSSVGGEQARCPLLCCDLPWGLGTYLPLPNLRFMLVILRLERLESPLPRVDRWPAHPLRPLHRGQAAPAPIRKESIPSAVR